MNDYRDTGKKKNVDEVPVFVGGKIYIVAVVTRKIKANEELLTDYGDHFWSEYHERCIQAAEVQQLRKERDQALADKERYGNLAKEIQRRNEVLEKQNADLRAQLAAQRP
eukprot:COSAG02_NODE_1093_length_14617_cov_13.078661_8_plen_110_part_00